MSESESQNESFSQWHTVATKPPSHSVPQYKIQNFTSYPYSRLQLFEELKIPPEADQPLYLQKECIPFIKEELLDMDKYDYNFLYTSKKEPSRQFRSLRRKVKLKFHCDDCPDKTWTSIVGTIQILFRIEDITEQDEDFQQEQDEYFQYEQDKPNKLVNFRVKLYLMECIKCQKWGVPQIYESQLLTVARIFCVTIAEILDKVPRYNKKKSDRHKMNEEVHDHKQELCEACLNGKCFARPKNSYDR